MEPAMLGSEKKITCMLPEWLHLFFNNDHNLHMRIYPTIEVIAFLQDILKIFR